MERGDLFLAAAAVAVGAIGAVILLVNYLPSTAAAEWTQAIGTIAAVIASGWLGSTDARRARRLDAENLERAVVLMLPVVGQITHQLRTTWEVSRDSNAGLDYIGEDKSVIATMLLGIAPLDREGGPWLEVLTPDIVETFSAAERALHDYRTFVSDAIPRFRLMGADERDSYKAVSRLYLRDALNMFCMLLSMLGDAVHRDIRVPWIED